MTGLLWMLGMLSLVIYRLVRAIQVGDAEAALEEELANADVFWIDEE